MSEPALTVDAILAQAHALGVDRLDAQLLIAHRLQQSRSWVIAHGDDVLDTATAQAVRADLQRRADGVPLAYLTGWHEFHGLALRVTPAVLDPRPDTETLADWALELLAGELAALPAPQVVDLGTGSGAIALAVAHGCPRAVVRAVDASADALAVARANGERLGLPVQWLLGDWWQPVGAPAVDLAVANPPYIAAADPHLPALRHEPLQALSPGVDGLAALRAIVEGASAHLCRGAWLLLEHGHDQADAVRRMLAAAGFDAVATRRDLAGHERCTGGRWGHGTACEIPQPARAGASR
ncbi:peptide chain release factor N(5)-glutamine methyltransferase [Calidifontimicrobium sp. SYSU G02091]|uniref:peptide chain release factor N(5)-glutamine methyltransferase n=1 Tax=Calidifontimicrobium sp. SYSU G02091 TaxID=2926421 RepID=UPI001F53B9F4|nr:peptide chain release factor N(5)-glutamine methyltransferase [Calidifontimicrobium sp. SYSU G02091]